MKNRQPLLMKDYNDARYFTASYRFHKVIQKILGTLPHIVPRGVLLGHPKAKYSWNEIPREAGHFFLSIYTSLDHLRLIIKINSSEIVCFIERKRIFPRIFLTICFPHQFVRFYLSLVSNYPRKIRGKTVGNKVAYNFSFHYRYLIS